MRVRSSARPARSAQMAAARRSCHEMAVLRGRPVSRSQASTVSPWLAKPTAATPPPARATASPSRLADRVPQLLGVLFDTAPRHRPWRHGGLDRGHDVAVLAEDDRLGGRGPLVDGQDPHRTRSISGIGWLHFQRHGRRFPHPPLILTGGKRLPKAGSQLFPSRDGEACYRARNTRCYPGRAAAEQRGMHVPEGVVEDEVDISSLSLDEQELARMGYKQELNRSWSGFSNFAISFSIISILAGCFTTFYSRLERRRAGRHRLGLADSGGPRPLHRTLPVGTGVGLPDLGWHLLVGFQARRGEVGLLHGLAEPHRAARHCRVGRLRLRHLLRPHARLPGFPGSYTSGNLDTIFLYFMAILAHRRRGQHLLEPPARHLQQHLGVLARDRRRGHRADPDLPAASPRQRQHGLHLDGQQHRVLRRQDERVRASSSSSCPSAPC